LGKYRIAIIIPAYNESNSITGVVRTTLNYGSPIVVDDGSTDDTAKKAAQAGAIVVKLPFNKGYDEALNAGFKKAKNLQFNACVTFDADGQHSPYDLPKFIFLLKKGTDIVIGERDYRPRVMERIFSLYTNLFLKVKDPFSGMKGYSMELYQKIGFFCRYKSLGTELMFNGIKNGFTFDHVQITVKKRLDQSRLGNAFSANCKIYIAIINYFFRKKVNI